MLYKLLLQEFRDFFEKWWAQEALKIWKSKISLTSEKKSVFLLVEKHIILVTSEKMFIEGHFRGLKPGCSPLLVVGIIVKHPNGKVTRLRPFADSDQVVPIRIVVVTQLSSVKIYPPTI